MAEDIEIRIRKFRNREITPTEDDYAMVDDLSLYAMNDRKLYDRFMALVDNYNKKRAKNTYDETLAIKGIANNLAPAIVKSYREEMGLDRVSRDTKILLAMDLLYIMKNEYFDELR